MPARVIQLIRHAPVDLLKEYFSFLPSMKKIEWSKGNNQILKPLLCSIDELDIKEKKSVIIDFERILTMTDKAGQVAFNNVIKDNKTFYTLQNIYQRSLWAFLHNYDNFVKAEEIRHADGYIQDTTWDGFIGTRNIELTADCEQVTLFEDKIKDIFEIKENIRVEILNRYFYNELSKVSKSFQIIIHYNIVILSCLSYEEGMIITKSIHPVEELIITYDPNNGQVDIIAKGEQCKKTIAKAFANTLLSSPDNPGYLAIMYYNLDRLLQPDSLIILPEDGIEAVKILSLQFQEQRNMATFNIGLSMKHAMSIYTLAEKMIEAFNFLELSCKLISATILITFKPDKVHKSGRSLTISISCPNTCDIESKSCEDRVIVNKYINMWNLIEKL
jgi:hypothetical protein